MEIRVNDHLDEMEVEVGQVNFQWSKKGLKFNFTGQVLYDPTFEDDPTYSPWSFDGQRFTVYLRNKKSLEMHSHDYNCLRWNYRLVHQETPNTFLINLINGLTK